MTRAGLGGAMLGGEWVAARVAAARVAAAMVAAALVLLAPDPAHAFCRSSTETQPSGACNEGEEGFLLFWDRSCLDYVFHEDAFARIPDLSEQEIRDIFAASFETWREVDCGGDPFLVRQQDGVTDSDNPVSFVFDARNEAVMSVQTVQEWIALKQPLSAFAITFLWHDPNSGEIFDVDMALNLGQGPFGRCDEVCRDGRVDLQNTITHEAGHLLGLGHSDVPRSTMQFDAMPGETFMRDLEQDDEDGVCSLMLEGPGCADPERCTCPPAPIIPKVIKTSTGGCHVTRSAPSGTSTPWWLLALVLLRGTRRLRDRS